MNYTDMYALIPDSGLQRASSYLESGIWHLESIESAQFDGVPGGRGCGVVDSVNK
jgi:hypothetical protein